MDVEVFIEAMRTAGIDKNVADVVIARANAIKDEYDRIVERHRHERKGKGIAGKATVPTTEEAA